MRREILERRILRKTQKETIRRLARKSKKNRRTAVVMICALLAGGISASHPLFVRAASEESVSERATIFSGIEQYLNTKITDAVCEEIEKRITELDAQVEYEELRTEIEENVVTSVMNDEAFGFYDMTEEEQGLIVSLINSTVEKVDIEELVSKVSSAVMEKTMTKEELSALKEILAGEIDDMVAGAIYDDSELWTEIKQVKTEISDKVDKGLAEGVAEMKLQIQEVEDTEGILDGKITGLATTFSTYEEELATGLNDIMSFFEQYQKDNNSRVQSNKEALAQYISDNDNAVTTTDSELLAYKESNDRALSDTSSAINSYIESNDNALGAVASNLSSYIESSNSSLAETNQSLGSFKAAQEQKNQDLQTQIDALEEKMTQVFQSVSNGKSKIAALLTNLGVSTENDSSYSEMGAGIETIQSGGFERGRESVSLTDIEVGSWSGTSLNLSAQTVGKGVDEVRNYTVDASGIYNAAYQQGLADGANSTTPQTASINYTKHWHTGSSSVKGGCYTVPVVHTHTGNSTTYSGCYTVPVKHVHTAACYESYEYQELTGTKVCGSSNWKNYVLESRWTNEWEDGEVYGATCGDCGAYNSGAYVTCNLYSVGASCQNTINVYTKKTGQRLKCGKTTDTIVGYSLGCGLNQNQILSYSTGCGYADGQILEAVITFN